MVEPNRLAGEPIVINFYALECVCACMLHVIYIRKLHAIQTEKMHIQIKFIVHMLCMCVHIRIPHTFLCLFTVIIFNVASQCLT